MATSKGSILKFKHVSLRKILIPLCIICCNSLNKRILHIIHGGRGFVNFIIFLHLCITRTIDFLLPVIHLLLHRFELIKPAGALFILGDFV